MRWAVAWLCCIACGRIDFGADSGVVRFRMDDDPHGGLALADPPQYSATCQACPTATTGMHGGGYRFDGGAYLTLPTGALVGDHSYTVAAWAFPDTSGAYLTIVAKPTSSTLATDVLNLLVQPNNNISYETTITGADIDYLYSSANVVGVWHHIVASYDGMTKHLYVDGAVVATEPATIFDPDLQPILIGIDIDPDLQRSPFIGVLDDVVFYDRALSDAEIAALP